MPQSSFNCSLATLYSICTILGHFHCCSLQFYLSSGQLYGLKVNAYIIILLYSSINVKEVCLCVSGLTELLQASIDILSGHVARCLENFLFDQSFWLNEALVDDVEISVTLNQEHLATVYLGLLLQEGEREHIVQLYL